MKSNDIEALPYHKIPILDALWNVEEVDEVESLQFKAATRIHNT